MISPEAHDGKGYSFPSDLWALGCVLYEMSYNNIAHSNFMSLSSSN